MRKMRILIVAIVGIFIITGCGKSGSASNNKSGGLSIVTSFYPVYIATINIAADIPGVSVQNMTKPQTGCLHDYSLKPEDLKKLEKADVFVINGAGMEAFLDDVIRQRRNLNIIEASEGIELIKDESGEGNPHVWVSVTNMITYVENIADKLSIIDAANYDKYQKNSSIYIEKLEALKTDMHNKLDNLEKRDIITFHEAFPYFAQEFNLNIAAVVQREPGTEPAPKEFADIIDLVDQTGIKALFAEPQYSSRAADAIARETGARVYTLDPVVTGEADPDSHDAYINAMERNKEILLEALE